jgi:hypothetical protein
MAGRTSDPLFDRDAGGEGGGVEGDVVVGELARTEREMLERVRGRSNHGRENLKF